MTLEIRHQFSRIWHRLQQVTTNSDWFIVTLTVIIKRVRLIGFFNIYTSIKSFFVAVILNERETHPDLLFLILNATNKRLLSIWMQEAYADHNYEKTYTKEKL